MYKKILTLLLMVSFVQASHVLLSDEDEINRRFKEILGREPVYIDPERDAVEHARARKLLRVYDLERNIASGEGSTVIPDDLSEYFPVFDSSSIAKKETVVQIDE